jgi:hypothetical protein
MDLIMVLVVFVFFGITWLLLKLCERLLGGAS